MFLRACTIVYAKTRLLKVDDMSGQGYIGCTTLWKCDWFFIVLVVLHFRCASGASVQLGNVRKCGFLCCVVQYNTMFFFLCVGNIRREVNSVISSHVTVYFVCFVQQCQLQEGALKQVTSPTSRVGLTLRCTTVRFFRLRKLGVLVYYLPFLLLLKGFRHRSELCVMGPYQCSSNTMRVQGIATVVYSRSPLTKKHIFKKSEAEIFQK